MKDALEIRKATPLDFQSVLAFYRLVDAEFFPPLSQRFPLQEIVRRCVASEDETCYLGIDVTGHIGAAITIQRNIDGDPTKAYLNFFAVRPDSRKSGVGFAFRRKVLQALNEEGIRTVRTRTWSTNQTMLSMNKKLGFEVDSVVRDDRGPGVDTIYFVKRFD